MSQIQNQAYYYQKYEYTTIYIYLEFLKLNYFLITMHVIQA